MINQIFTNRRKQQESPIYDVFISYARRNKHFVETLVERLEAQGLQCWIDKEPDAIGKGEPFELRIRDGIDRSQIFLAIISPDYLSRPYCHAELHYALKKDYSIIPLMYIAPFDAQTFDWTSTHNYFPPANEFADMSTDVLLDGEPIDTHKNLQAIQLRNWFEVSEIPSQLETRLQQAIPTANGLPFYRKLGIYYDTAGKSDPEAFDRDLAKYADDTIAMFELELVQAITIPGDDLRKKMELNQRLRNYENGTGDLLQGTELESFRKWALDTDWKRRQKIIDSNRFDIDPSPTTEQLTFVTESMSIENRRSRQQRITISTVAVVLGILLIVAIILAVVANSATNRAETEADNANQEAARANRNAQLTNYQLQSLALADSIRYTETGRTPLRPLRTDNTLWVVQQTDNNIQGYATHTGQPITRQIPTGGSPFAPLLDENGNAVLVVSAEEGLVTRIDINDPETVITASVGEQIRSAHLMPGAWLWLTSVDTLYQINPDNLNVVQTFELSLGIDPPIVGNEDSDYFWVFDRQSIGWWQVNGRRGNPQFITATSRTQQLVPANNFVWRYDGTLAQPISIESLAPSEPIEFDRPITQIVADTDGLWLIESGDEADARLWKLDHSGTVIHAYDLPDVLVVERLTLSDGMLLVWTSTTIHAFQLDNRSIVERWSTTVEHTQRLSSPVSDHSNLWFVEKTGRNITILRRSDGDIIRNVPVCRGANRPLFDGATMWVSCSNLDEVTGVPTGSLAAIPAFSIYHGSGGATATLEDFELNVRDYVPVIINNRIWSIQEVDGLLTVYDIEADCMIGSISVGTYPTLPYVDLTLPADDPAFRKLWLGTEATVEGVQQYALWRFDLDGAYRCNDPDFGPDVRIPVNSESAALTRLGDTFWVTTYSDDFQGQTVLFVDLETNELSTDTIDSLAAIASPVYKDGFSGEYAYVGNMNAEGSTLDEVHLSAPTTAVRSLRLDHLIHDPLITEDVIWISGTCAGGTIDCVMPLFTSEFDLQSTLFKIDYQHEALEIIGRFEFEDAVASAPTVAGDYVWLLFTDARLQVITAPYSRGYSELSAIAPETGEVVATFDPCENLLPPYYNANAGVLWAVCIGLEDDPGHVQVIDLNSTPPRLIQFYEDLGVEAFLPVHFETINELWISYRRSGTVARFDADTGRLMRLYTVGNGAGPPVLDADGNVWIANTADASFQKIRR